MRKRHVFYAATIMVLAGIVGFFTWIVLLPSAGPAIEARPVPQQETVAMIEALRPPKRARPLIAIVGINDATETTDYLTPAGILRRANIADVRLLATNSGPVKLYPALLVEADATVAAFDAEYPEGADYVIVPAMSRDDDPTVLAWLQEQSSKGAILISVCAGAKVLAAAGLLDGRRATTHWYYLDDLRALSPTFSYVPDRRFVIDDGVVTTTGISASMPMMVTLIEAIGGSAKAHAVANHLGIREWDARHSSVGFKLTRPFVATIISNAVPLWNRQDLALKLTRDMDEVTLALTADAWSRTYRSQVFTFADQPEAVTSRNGVKIVPDRHSRTVTPAALISPGDAPEPALALEEALRSIGKRYGQSTADVVAMQLEYQPEHQPGGHHANQ